MKFIVKSLMKHKRERIAFQKNIKYLLINTDQCFESLFDHIDNNIATNICSPETEEFEALEKTLRDSIPLALTGIVSISHTKKSSDFGIKLLFNQVNSFVMKLVMHCNLIRNLKPSLVRQSSDITIANQKIQAYLQRIFSLASDMFYLVKRPTNRYNDLLLDLGAENKNIT